MVIVDFDPTIGDEIQKRRPALIIQNDIDNRYSPVTIVAAITETTSCGTPSRVHAARTVPVRRIRRATSIPASGWIVEKIAGPARSSIPSFENSVVSLLPRALAPE